MSISTSDLKTHLNGFTWTQGYHRTSIFSLVVTDGVLAMAKKAGAFWLIDQIGMYQGKAKRLPFQVWTLEVKNQKAVLTLVEDIDQPVLVKKKISYTNFPDGSWKFYVQNGVMMLPSEY